jgi:hypothetical protein
VRAKRQALGDLEGIPTMSSSAVGNRSRVAKRSRPSTTTVRSPSTRAISTNGIATCVAPKTTSVLGGACTSK